MQKQSLTQNEMKYVYTNLYDNTQNIYCADASHDIYLIQCKNLKGNFYIRFNDKHTAKMNYKHLNDLKFVKAYFRGNNSLSIDVYPSGKFNIVATYNDFKGIITSLRRQVVEHRHTQESEDNFNR